MASASRKNKKPAKKTKAKPRKPAQAKKRSQAKPAKRASSQNESSDALVYTDIRRSMHGAILRHLR